MKIGFAWLRRLGVSLVDLRVLIVVAIVCGVVSWRLFAHVITAQLLRQAMQGLAALAVIGCAVVLALACAVLAYVALAGIATSGSVQGESLRPPNHQP